MAREIWTVGHSNREIKPFIELLETVGIELVADVRRFPGSRTHPQFNRAALRDELQRVGIGYRHWEGLGGRRRRQSSASVNTAWRVESFNAYADHMGTSEFQHALQQLIVCAEQQRTAILCAEAVPWRCHRRLIADVLVARGWEIYNILGPAQIRPHTLTPFAHVREGRVTYPGGTLFD